MLEIQDLYLTTSVKPAGAPLSHPRVEPKETMPICSYLDLSRSYQDNGPPESPWKEFGISSLVILNQMLLSVDGCQALYSYIVYNLFTFKAPHSASSAITHLILIEHC